MQDTLSLFEGTNPDFGNLSNQNGNIYWYASVLMDALGYNEFKHTAKPILKASQVCINTGINPLEHFIYFENERNGKKFRDIKLTRFACYLVVRNALIENGSILPEDLPPSEDIRHIKSGLKKTHKAFNKNDKNKPLIILNR